MAARASWKGYLKLSLVSCAVALFPASTTGERVSFHTLNRATGNRLRQQMIDEVTGEVVEREDRAKGYEVAKGEHIIIDDDELDAIQIESTHTIDIEQFVPASEVDQVYLNGSHYLAPDDRVAEEAFAVIREAMRTKDVVGIGRVVMARRERLLALYPRGKGILATTLRYNYEVRKDAAYFDEITDVEIPEEMLDLATHIIGRKAGHFDVSRFEDRYEKALVEMLRAKQEGRPAEQREAPKPSNVVNLMDALRRSIETDKGAGSDERRPAAKSKSSAAAKSAPAASAQPAAKAKPAAAAKPAAKPAAEPAAKKRRAS